MERLWKLADPTPVARFQQFCGVELIKPGTCDQQTQTKRQNSVDEKEGTPLINESGLAAGDECRVGGDVSNGKVPDLKHRNKKSDNNIKECNNNGTKWTSHCEDTCNGSYSKDNLPHTLGKTFIGKNGFSNGTSNTPSDEPTVAKVSPAYTIKYKSLLYLAYFGAFLGNEEFYLTVFPFCVWNLDSLIVRQISLLWGLVMYLGQATKDYLCWPRPPCPPVVRLEFAYLQEFSMPSTHAMAGAAIPLYMAHLVVDRYQVPVPIAAGIALFWFTSTCFSRLYLGVHSILDLIAGIVYSLFLYVSFIKYIEGYDLYQQTHRFAPVMVMVTAFVLCTVFYPSKHRVSSKGDAVQIVASVAGFSIGFWLLYQMGISHTPTEPKPYSIPFPTLEWVFVSCLRFISGLLVLGAYYSVCKPASIRFFSYLYGLEFPDKSNSNVVTGYKFTTYFSIGIIISFFIPLMHVWLGIPRNSFFEEVV